VERQRRRREEERRAQGRQTTGVLRFADVELDPKAHTASRAGLPLRLGPTAFAILEALLRASPAVVPRAELEQALWGDSPPDSDALRTHIHELRRKMDKPFATALLKTIPHVGFVLQKDGA
ncbi:MAG: winged helix-turn-helix domain-containing protein, partial [Desulfovibrionaceae bacterium]|nr:winged helix-turn-helix domain-containing protein [Desulfovibrionaceae bacterium]